MELSKIVDDIVVHIRFQADSSPKTCFIVFSSREKHVEVLIDWIESVFAGVDYKLVRLDEQLKSGDSQYQELTDQLSSSSFAIVVLDGFRPNVLFEYGILKGLKKPCIVLLEKDAAVDIQGYYPPGQTAPVVPATIDMDKHFSDVKDRFYVRYDKNQPKESRALILEQYGKLKASIESEFLHVLCPHKDVIVNRELPNHLATIAAVFNKNEGCVTKEDLAAVNVAKTNVERLASDYRLALPKRYSWTVADIYRKAGDSETAIKIIDGALTGTKSDANLYSVKARILRDIGNIQAAIESLDQAIALYPDAESFWHNKALCLDRIGRTAEALSCYEKAIALDSTCSSVDFHYGIMLYERKEFEKAHLAFSRAAKKDPGARHVLLWKARSLDKTGNTPDAIAILRGLISTDSNDANALFALAIMTEDEQEELQLLDKVLTLVPEHSGAICSRAAVLSNLGKPAEALQFLDKLKPSCKDYPKCPTILATIAITLSRLGKISEAISAAERLLSIDPKSEIGRSVKAYCCAKAGRPGEGVSLLEELVSEGPLEAASWYDLSCCYAVLGQVDQVVRCLAKAMELDRSLKENAQSEELFAAVRNDPSFLQVFVVFDSRN